MGNVKTGLIAAAAICLLAAPASASTIIDNSDIVYQDGLVPLVGTQKEIVQGPSNGLQQWVGNLGMDFTVIKPVSVYALGAFDNGLSTELNGTTNSGIDVGIFNVNTGQLVGTSVHFSQSSVVSQINGDAFLSLAHPFSLTAGTYSIVSLNDPNYNQGYFGGPNMYQTLNSLGGSISFTGPSVFDGNATNLEYPGTTDGPPVDRYDAGTFAAMATPLPSTWSMMLIGLAGLGFVAYRRQKHSTSLAAA